MSIHHVRINRIDGSSLELSEFADRTLLVVNVASKCGLTPQYEALEELQRRYAERGFSVIGVPCNQFLGQEPGTGEEIQQFCSTTYGVTFPLLEKIDVNGDGRHELYEQLTSCADDEGYSGDIRWNFEKFLVDRSGAVVARFAPVVTPDDPAIVGAIEDLLEAD
jgi:glutathione peroxidase